MCALPARRLQALIKSADKIFDETWTVGLTPAEASSLLWALTHIHPSSKSHAIGAKTYREGKAACTRAAQRLKKLMGQQKYALMVTEVLRAGPNDFFPVIQKYGFEPEWIEQRSQKKRRKGAPDEGAPHEVKSSIPKYPRKAPPPDLAFLAPSQDKEQTPPDLAPRTTSHSNTSQSNAEALPDLAPRTTSQSNAEARPDLAPLAPAQSNAKAPPDLASLAPAQGLTSEQRAKIAENRAVALAKRRAKSKAKSNAKAQARRTASSRNETDEEDIGGEEDITVGEEDITVEGAVVPAPQSRGPISDREMAERDAAERPQCVICQDFFEKDEEATTLECGHVFHSECIANYARSKMVTLERACPFKCRAREVLIVDENDEAEQQRASLLVGLLLQAQQAEQAADAAFT